MRGVWWIAVLVVALGPEAARADMTAPGFKARNLRVVIDNLDDYPDHAFYLVAVSWVDPSEKKYGPGKPQQPPQVKPGQPHFPER